MRAATVFNHPPAWASYLTAPAAGLDFSLTVPWHIQLHTIYLPFTTSAALPVRRVHVQIMEPAGNSLTIDISALDTQGASMLRNYAFAPWGVAPPTADGYIYVPMPPLPVAPGWTIQTLIAGLDVGDQIGVPVLSGYLLE